MIDLHTHILPGLDDGAKDLRESLLMCQIAYRDGIRTIVATPHTLNGVYQNDRSRILARVQALNAALAKFGLENPRAELRDPIRSEFRNPRSEIPNPNSKIQNPKSEIRILPGADVHFSHQTLHYMDGGKVMTIGGRGKCVLLEFPFQGIPFRGEDVLFQMMAKGVIPIITHPERNLEVGQNPRRYYEIIRMGCLGQVTAMSVTGGFGPEVKRVAENLLSMGLVHVIASDAHSSDGRPPVLSHALRAAGKIVGREEAWKMVTEYPKAILEGQRPNVPDSISPK